MLKRLPCVSEHADEIAQIGGLVAVEEVFLQIERFEDEIGVLLVQPVLAEEGVIARGDVGPGGIEHSQLVHPAGGLDGWKKIGEKLLVALAVENQHGNPVLVFGGPTTRKRSWVMMFLRSVVLPEPVAPNTTDCITRVASGQNQGLP